MSHVRMFAPDVRVYPVDSPFLIQYQDAEGTHAAMGFRVPSLRTDILKLTMVGLMDGKVQELKLHESATRDLTDGKANYQLYEPNEKEVATMARRMKELGVQV